MNLTLLGESARPGSAFEVCAIQEIPLPQSYSGRLPLVYNPSGPWKFASFSLPWQASTGGVGILHLSLIFSCWGCTASRRVYISSDEESTESKALTSRAREKQIIREETLCLLSP